MRLGPRTEIKTIDGCGSYIGGSGVGMFLISIILTLTADPEKAQPNTGFLFLCSIGLIFVGLFLFGWGKKSGKDPQKGE